MSDVEPVGQPLEGEREEQPHGDNRRRRLWRTSALERSTQAQRAATAAPLAAWFAHMAATTARGAASSPAGSWSPRRASVVSTAGAEQEQPVPPRGAARREEWSGGRRWCRRVRHGMGERAPSASASFLLRERGERERLLCCGEAAE